MYGTLRGLEVLGALKGVCVLGQLVVCFRYMDCDSVEDRPLAFEYLQLKDYRSR